VREERINMALTGVNKLCNKCTQKCKQWKEIAVVHCPNYRSAGFTVGKQGK
jgi:hypothetical protein